MADDLGTAVLRITVNDEAARESLRLLRQDIQRSTRVGGAGGRAQGGARESIRALEQAQERRFRLAQRIERLENQGVNVSRLRARLGEATTAQANREFEKQRRISIELNRQVRLAEARLQRERQLDTALTRQARIGGARESVRGRVGLTGSPADLAFLARQGGARSPIGGRVGLTGSPADLAFLARQGGARLPVGGGVNIPGSPAFLAAELSRSARLGGARSPIGGAISIPGSPAAIRAEERLAAARQRAAQAAERASQAEGRRIGRLNASPIRGGAAFPGSPEFIRLAQQRRAALGFDAADTTQALAAQTARRRLRFQGELGRRSTEAISSGLIGGAFPLLFGQGIGAAIGGGAGGLGGGALGGQFGFGLSLVGTAVGAAFDEALNKGKALAAGLDDPIGKFEELRAAALFSSSATEKQISALISQGREAEAAAQIQLDLLRTYGDTTDLDGLKTAYDELGRAFNQLSVVTAKFVAGPLSDFITKLAASFGAQANRALFDERVTDLGIDAAGRTAVIGQARKNIAEEAKGLPNAQAAILLYEEANRLLDEQFGKRQEIIDAEEKSAAVAARQLRIDQLRTDLVNAQARGEDRKANLIQQELNDLDRLQKLSAAPAEAREGIGRAAGRTDEQLTADLLKLDRDRLATSTLQIAQFRLQSTELERQFQQAQRIAAIGTGAGVTVARDNARFIGGLDEQIRQARQAEADIAAQISAEQLRGGDQAAQRIAELGRQQVTAAQTTRNLIFEAATQLRDAGQQLARDLGNAVTNFTAIRSDPQGLNRFLSPQAQTNRAQGDFRLLLPQFRNAQAQFERLTGERAPEFTGTTAGVNAAIRDFINAVNAEDVAQQVLIQTNEALALTNEKLVTAQTNLAVVTAALVEKDWNVQVLVNGAPSPIPLPAGGLP